MNGTTGRTSIFLAAALLLPGQALGQTAGQPEQTPPTRQSPKEPAQPRLGIGEIVVRVEAQGYRDIEEVEREGDGYEICAKDAQGREVELEVNGATGRVEKVEVSDD